ncbi:protein ROS1A-like [Abrus precatorius]|uniref:Protein ROS1A-like n=1 Tax=Abrus precatorius TaxID=3816 RepID=A0A8B8KHX3_ABRPR|nr:protein ROS1A-like [Abrus precatorius]
MAEEIANYYSWTPYSYLQPNQHVVDADGDDSLNEVLRDKDQGLEPTPVESNSSNKATNQSFEGLEPIPVESNPSNKPTNKSFEGLEPTPVESNSSNKAINKSSEDDSLNEVLRDKDPGLEPTPVKSNSSNKATNQSSEADLEFSPTKRKNKREENRKIYRPKIISESPNKSRVKSNDTPKPSTPKQKRSSVRRDSSCKRQLFSEDLISLPFLKKFNKVKVEQGGFENSIIHNELGIAYNSIQRYHKVESLSSLCLVESRQIGMIFPLMCKKKRIPRGRLRLEKLLAPFKRGKRSTSLVRKRKCWMVFELGGDSVIDKKLITRIKKIRSLTKKKGRKTKELVANKELGALVPYKQSSLDINVLLDEETLRVWNLLKDENGHEENDEMKQKSWESIRSIFRDKVESFLWHMHFIQGDRRFLPWKGSVLDSVIGTFLTQNVSDHLSSSAFMTLAAKFPIKTNREKGMEDLDKQEMPSYSVVFPSPEFDREMEDCKLEEMEGKKVKESSKLDDSKGTENSSSLTNEKIDPLDLLSVKKISTAKKKSKKEEEKEILEEKQRCWDRLRKIHTKSPRDSDHMDSVDWEAVRCAPVGEVARVIASRGQHNMIAERIQRLLNGLRDSNGKLDLEWLRYAPQKEAKEYLLNIYGLGLKSVECIRLLTLHHMAFPVDVNVGRIVVRLGWVPLQPLPKEIQIHNLEMYPDSNKIQQYLWPRLCTLDQRTLYELHYQLITFGKVFCTKKYPNCAACPMKNECKHYASVVARYYYIHAKLALPEPPTQSGNSFKHSTLLSNSPSTVVSEENNTFIPESSKGCEPIIEIPASPEPESNEPNNFDVKNEDEEFKRDDVCNDIEDFPTIVLSSQETHNYYSKDYEQEDMNKSTAVVLLHDVANIPLPKMKNVSRLKTERKVWVLPDNHPLLAEHSLRELNDPCPYLLVIWTEGELQHSRESSENSLQEEENGITVPGTLLIPCRTAMRGSFPLNGTYFQVNEVFADYDSMIRPINVPRKWLWNLENRIVYFGTGISSIMRDLKVEQIHECFWNGFICVRAMDSKTRASRPISSILHRNTTARVGKGNKNEREDEE